MSERQPRSGDILAWIVAAVAAALVVLGWLAPPNLLMNDQEKPAGYVADIIHNESWLVQRDQTNDVASKPPLQNWLAALSVMAVGRDRDGLLTDFGLRLPSLVAVLVTGWLVWLVADRYLGRRVAYLACLALLAGMPALRMAGLIRTDPLFMLFVAAGSFALFRVAETGRGWLGAGVFVLLATMTKGPLVMALCLFGLLGYGIPGRGRLAPPVGWGSVLVRSGGALLIGALGTLAWFLSAIQIEGQDVWDKLIGRELVGLATGGTKVGGGGSPVSPWIYLIPRWAPWSVVVIVAVAMVWMRRTRTGAGEDLLRFCAASFMGGMILFMVGAHHRMDHLYPLLPAAAILVGWTLDGWLSRPGVCQKLALAVLGVGLVLFAGSFLSRFSSSYLDVQRSLASRQAARELLQRTLPGEEPVFIALNSPQAVQYYLGLNRRTVDHGTGIRVLLETSQTLVLVRERGPQAPELGMRDAGPIAMLWVTDQSVEGAEEAGDTDNLWHMGLVVANTVERPADWPWRGHRAVVAGGTTEPVLLGPVTVIRANRRHLVVDTMGLLRGEVFPDGDPAVEVVHGEDWTGVRWPGLPMGRGVAAVLFVLFWAGVAFAIRSPFVSRETYPRTSPPEMES